MKYHHIKRTWKSPFFVNFRKHNCVDCGEPLQKIKVAKIVNSRSPEAKDFDFHSVDAYMIGNVKFIWTEFLCPKCGKQFSIDRQKQIEKSK